MNFDEEMDDEEIEKEVLQGIENAASAFGKAEKKDKKSKRKLAENKTSSSISSSISSHIHCRESMKRRNSIIASGQIGSSIFTNVNAQMQREKLEEDDDINIIFPWNEKYKIWWTFTVLAAAVTFFYETYELAFLPGGLFAYDTPSSIFDYSFMLIFLADIIVNFNLAYYDDFDQIIVDRRSIANKYFGYMFWIDLLGVIPFYPLMLAMSGLIGKDTTASRCLAIFRLLRLVRLYRIIQVFEILKYSSKVSLFHLTLIRNFSAALFWAHFAACIMYFIAKLQDFDKNTWLPLDGTPKSYFKRYCMSLYWSITTFTTVGYGDLTPVNSFEQIWSMIYMMMNIVFMAYFIGSITLLVVKSDQKTGNYREKLRDLNAYSSVNDINIGLLKQLRTQLKLDFNNREVSDEQVLQTFPTAVRRKVLRKLYFSSLRQTTLLNGVRHAFIEEFLGSCRVEVFSPEEEILQQGSISNELYFLVSGTVELSREYRDRRKNRELRCGDFINEIAFFTESFQIDTIRTVTVCKTLTLCRSAYKKILDHYSGSSGKILQNLLAKVEKIKPRQNTPLDDKTPPERFDINVPRSLHDSNSIVYTESAISMIRDLVKRYLDEHKDIQTTQFLFAASRNCFATISFMCDEGIDPNCTDFDNRTALMVASMKGHIDSVETLLQYGANPNLKDIHGATALYEAIRNGNEHIVDTLLEHKSTLCMDDIEASNFLCAAVFRNNLTVLKRLLKAHINVNASDYDNRTAIHIAAAENNFAAFKILVEFGADVTARDRWKNSALDEAKRINASQILEYIRRKELAQSDK